MLTPTVPSPRWASRRAAAAAPALLKPIRLISARSRGSRNSRGRGLPGWASAVTVPTSTNPKPSASSASMPAASLSNPAASPSGPGSSRPSAWTPSSGRPGPRRGARGRGGGGGGGAPHHPRAAGRRDGGGEQRERYAVRGLGRRAAQHEPVEQAVHRREYSSIGARKLAGGLEHTIVAR